jgi:hypothetical protein
MMEVPPAGDHPAGLPSGFGPAGRAGAPPVERLRLTFAKGRELRYIGHLDLVRLWERAFRRARLPLAYTLGYTPHPRFTFASPLALGATGGAELLDVYLRERLPAQQVVDALRGQLPPGCSVVGAAEVALDGPAVAALTRWAAYYVEVCGPPGDSSLDAGLPDGAPPAAEPGVHEPTPAGERERRREGSAPGPTGPFEAPDAALAETVEQGSRWASASGAAQRPTAPEPAPDHVPWRPESERLPPSAPPRPLPPREVLAARIAELLAAQRWPRVRQREGRRIAYDLRPLVFDAWLDDEPGQPGQAMVEGGAAAAPERLGMVLRLDSGGAGRPEEVAAALGVRASLIHRVRIGLEGDEAPGQGRDAR